MTIIVTGGADCIGSNFVLDWFKTSDEPIVIRSTPELGDVSGKVYTRNQFGQGGVWAVFETTPQTAFVGIEPESRPESRPESEATLKKRVLKLIHQGPQSKREISTALGQKEVSGQLNKVIRNLMATGRVEPTIPDKPNSRLQKYRLTQKGPQ